MSITVADCLRVPALHEAQVVAGHNGLDRIVSNVTVLEYANAAALESQLFLGNEMIISALVSVKDDVEAQCKVLCRLHEMGEVYLILYYVGIYVPRVDEKLIKIADELDFPLIVMPTFQYNHRYSEAIADVVAAIINDQKQETDLVTSMLDRIALLKEELRNIGVVMRMLSDRLRCSLLLGDRKGQNLAFAAWPMAAHWAEEDLNRIISQRHEQPTHKNSQMKQIRGRSLRVSSVSFDIEKQNGLFLLCIDEHGTVDEQYLRQAAEVLQLFANIWNDDFAREGPDALLRAILSNQPVEMRRIARNLHIDVESLDTMWIVMNRDEKLSRARRRQLGERMAGVLTNYVQENFNTILVDVFETYVMAFMGMPRRSAAGSDLREGFVEEMLAVDGQALLVACTNLDTTEDVRSAYVLMEQNIEIATKIFPLRRVISMNELQFANTCRLIGAEGEAAVMKYMALLKPILREENGDVVADTLTAFMLDYRDSIQATAAHMFIHKNTVKYRLRRAKECLGYDVTKMPEMIDLYTALAIYRIMARGREKE